MPIDIKNHQQKNTNLKIDPNVRQGKIVNKKKKIYKIKEKFNPNLTHKKKKRLPSKALEQK